MLRASNLQKLRTLLLRVGPPPKTGPIGPCGPQARVYAHLGPFLRAVLLGLIEKTARRSGPARPFIAGLGPIGPLGPFSTALRGKLRDTDNDYKSYSLTSKPRSKF